jgi:CrcB protein
MNQTFLNYLAVGGGGALGAVARLAVGQLLSFTSFPLGTLAVNVSGCFFLGWFATAVGSSLNISETTRMAVAVGFIGAFTTFSTYMLDFDRMMQSGSRLASLGYLVASLVLGLVAVRLGVLLAARPV